MSTSVSGKKKPKVHSVQEAAARTVEAAKPRDNEADISDWLDEEEEDDAKVNKLTTTLTPVPKPAKEIPAKELPNKEVPAEQVPAEVEQQRIQDPMAGPGQQKKPMAEDKRAAAADMLKQFFKPRR